MINISVKDDDRAEFIGQIIDMFEDFLTDRGVELDNMDKQDALENGEDADTLAVIYGEDYDELQDGLECIFEHWNK